MKRIITIATACFAALFLALCALDARAQFVTNDKNYLTFSAPVELPGMTLPAGTYTFRLADTPSRNVIQVLSQDEKKIFGQFLFAPSRRREPSADPVVTFKETAANTTPAVQYWYYPQQTSGREFIYPKDQAMKIAARTHSTVLAVESSAPDSQISSIDDSGNVTAYTAPAYEVEPAQSAALEPEPSNQIASSATVSTSGQSDDQAVGTSGQSSGEVASRELPHTASPVPLTGLLGLFSLASGLALRAVRR